MCKYKWEIIKQAYNISFLFFSIHLKSVSSNIPVSNYAAPQGYLLDAAW